MASMNGRGPVAPSEFPPPVDSVDEFVKRELDPEDERIDVGVVIVGGGPAGLACANRLLQLLGDEPELMERLGEVPVAVIEKGKTCGAHNLSRRDDASLGAQGAVPRRSRVGVADARHGGQGQRLLDARAEPKLPLKPTPPPFRNHGNHMVSVAELSRWLAARGRGGRRLHPDRDHRAAAARHDGAVRASAPATRAAARTARRSGTSSPARTSPPRRRCWPRAPGAISPARRSRSSGWLASREPQVWALGVKEVWKVEKPLDRVIHTLGWPLRYGAKWHEFGGSWIYPMGSRPRLDRLRGRPRLHRRHRLAARPAPAVQDLQAGAGDPRGRQARRLGRQGDPRGRLLVDAQALERPGW